ncbi:MAG: hypothetical protein RJA44_912 [Pseudomonadota bacterium]
MAIRNLYLSIYLTVVAVLLVFTLIAGLLLHHHADVERDRIERVVSERSAAWAQLIEHSLPPGTAPQEQQREALREWGRRLRLALALDSAQGQRIASSDLFDRMEGEHRANSVPSRVELSDGRGLWIYRRPLPRPDLPDPPPEPHQPVFDWPRHGPEAYGPPDGERGDSVLMRWLERPHHGEAQRWPWLPRWLEESVFLLAPLVVLFIAIAAGSYPVVRRLTRRLERLQHGVETFGGGDLGHRVKVDGRDEVAGLAASFNQAAQRIEDLVRSNRSLLANASHELRSPLARLKMAVAMSETAGPAQRDALRAEINRDIRELDALVDEVLLASRLDSQTAIGQDKVDLLGIGAEEAMRVDAALNLPDEVESAADTWLLRGDERLLRRALRNLLENARRYGGDAVELQLQPAAERLRLVVCDRGSGVPEAERERIFEPFYRLPGHAEHAGGVGLGLSLVRQIARRHGGEVHCEERPGGGSCFVLDLPRGLVPAEGEAPQPSARSA